MQQTHYHYKNWFEALENIQEEEKYCVKEQNDARKETLLFNPSHNQHKDRSSAMLLKPSLSQHTEHSSNKLFKPSHNLHTEHSSAMLLKPSHTQYTDLLANSAHNKQLPELLPNRSHLSNSISDIFPADSQPNSRTQLSNTIDDLYLPELFPNKIKISESDMKSENETKHNLETVVAVAEKIDKNQKKSYMTEQEKVFLEQLSIVLGTYKPPED